jgi:hypothetical protein
LKARHEVRTSWNVADCKAAILRVAERKKRKTQLGDRKSAAAQNRMKNIAALASDSPVSKKKRKGNGGEWRAIWSVCSPTDDRRRR